MPADTMNGGADIEGLTNGELISLRGTESLTERENPQTHFVNALGAIDDDCISVLTEATDSDDTRVKCIV